MEITKKAETTAKAAFGEQLQDMFWVQMLAASPNGRVKDTELCSLLL